MALFFSILYRSTEISHANNLCLPFLDYSRQITIIKIITYSVVFIQLMIAVLIVIIHFLLAKKIKQSQVSQETRKSVVDPESNFSLFLQLIVITISNILCWTSTNSVYLTAMFLNAYPTHSITFTVVTCLPLNSIIIPSESITFSVKKLWKKKKKEKRLNQGR